MSKINNQQKRSTTKGVQQKKKQQKRPSSQKARNNLLPGEAKGVAAAYSKGVRNNKPTIDYRNNGRECRVVHKEFVSNVTGTVAFATPIQLKLNPGLPTSFPWLSAIANNFETYRVNKMVFRYLTRTGSNTPGSVLVYPDYDAADSAPISEQIASNYQEICEDAPWKDISCPLRPSGMHALGPKKFVRATELANSLDIKTYDVGTLFLSTVDGTAVPWGKLWVEYDVTFFEPQLNPNGPVVFAGGEINGIAPFTAVTPLGTSPSSDPSSLGFSVNNQVVTFSQSATVLVGSSVAGTTLTAFSVTPSADATRLFLPILSINGAGNALTALDGFNVVPGSTLTFLSASASITASAIRIGIAPRNSLDGI